jgi:GxxExxY protein
MTKIPEANDPRTYAIIGAAMEVHSVRGSGFQETVYRDCCAIEFNIRGIPYVMEPPFPVTYKGHRVGGFYRADFLCYDEIIVEIKATNAKNTPLEHAQMLNYLAASGMTIGVLLNFGGPRLTFQRFVLSVASNHPVAVLDGEPQDPPMPS